MSTRNRVTTKAGKERGRDVAEYLRAHPQFFEEHPDVLGALEIPHARGTAVSLVERQLAVLRQENRQLKRRLTEIVNNAKHNERLSRRIRELTLALMDAAGMEELLAVLDERLRGDFGADEVILRIFAEPAFVGGCVAAFVGRDAAARRPFAQIIDAAVPVPGRPKRAHCEALLVDAASSPGSAVIMPLKTQDWDGVLMIRSRDEQRYNAAMGVDLLAHLGDIVSLVISPWVRRVRR
jgi:uncharacterized protein YigA (DUF484 family)